MGQDVISLTTLDKKRENKEAKVVQFQINNIDGSNTVHLQIVCILNELPIHTDNIATTADMSKWPYLEDISLPSLDAMDEVGLLIGQDTPAALMPLEVRHSEIGGPYATRTILGWTLNGLLGRNNEHKLLSIS